MGFWKDTKPLELLFLDFFMDGKAQDGAFWYFGKIGWKALMDV